MDCANEYYNVGMDEFNTTLYEMLGGESGLKSLVDRFYEIMKTSPETKELRAMHAHNLKKSSEKLFMFLSGWSGGPQLYVEKYGHPRLRQRHLPFSIGAKERDQWLWCMGKALDQGGYDPRAVEYLKTRFSEVADFMRNRMEIDL